MKNFKFIIFLIFIFGNILYAQAPIVTSPVDQAVTEGEVATFSVSIISGTSPFTYQWQVALDQNVANFADIPGATSSTYSTSPTTLDMDGNWYRCVVTNDSGTTVSNYATLTVNPIIAPTITVQPTDQSISLGETATFSLTATGTEPLTYQWYENSNPISGATASSYTTNVINDITADGTIYYCIVSNSGGSLESNPATLYVTYANERVTNNLQVLYNFKEGTGNVVNDESGVGTPLNLTISKLSAVSWTNRGLNVNSEVRIKSNDVATKIINSCKSTNEITFEAWLIPTDMVQRDIYARIMTMTNTSKSTSNIKLDQFGSDYNFRIRTTTTGLNGQGFTNSGNSQKLIHYVVTKDNAGNVTVYIDGAKVIQSLLSGDFSNWDDSYYLFLGSDAENNVYWKGTYYLTAIYNKALTENEVNQNFYFGVDSDSFPYIVEQPSNVSLLPVGETATFNVVAIGNSPLSYQWYRNNNQISGATDPSYTTPPITLGNNNDEYKCIVTSNDGSAESSMAVLTVAEPNERITLDMIAQYTFQDSSYSLIKDVSGVGDPVNLLINSPQAINWLTNGLQINSEADIFSENAATKIYSMCTSTNQLTIETWVKPLNTTQNSPARIVSYSQDGSARNFSLSQEADQYSARLRTTNTTNNAFPYLISNNNVVETKAQHVVFVFREDGVVIIFVNGVENGRRTLNGNFSNWDSSYKFKIVNEFLDSRPWLGIINYLAIFNRRLTSEEVVHNFNVGPYDVLNEIASPTQLVANSSQTNKIQLIWNDNAVNEDYYLVERNESDPVAWQQIASLPSNSTNYLDSNIVEGKNYSYRVKAMNTFLDIDTAYSNTVSVTTVLKKPTGLVGQADELGKITLVWNDNSSNEAGFKIERGNAEADSVVYIVVGSVDTNITKFDDFGIEEGVLYSYKVTAFNDFVVSESSNELSIRSKASFVLAPSNLQISLDPVSGVPVLVWDDNAFNENGFVIERKIAGVGANFVVVDSVGQDVTTFTDNSVKDSTSYIYRLYAFNDEYRSDNSSEEYVEVLVGVEDEIIPDKYSLLQNYPNPFNPSTTFTFNLPETSDINLTVYNLLGQMVQTIVSGKYSAGSYNILFEANKLTSGIYIYSLHATSNSGENFVQTRKFILLK